MWKLTQPNQLLYSDSVENFYKALSEIEMKNGVFKTGC